MCVCWWTNGWMDGWMDGSFVERFVSKSHPPVPPLGVFLSVCACVCVCSFEQSVHGRWLMHSFCIWAGIPIGLVEWMPVAITRAPHWLGVCWQPVWGDPDRRSNTNQPSTRCLCLCFYAHTITTGPCTFQKTITKRGKRGPSQHPGFSGVYNVLFGSRQSYSSVLFAVHSPL